MNSKFMQQNTGPFVNFLILFCFSIFIFFKKNTTVELFIQEPMHCKSEYLPSGTAVDGAGLEAGATCPGGGKAGLCPVHAKQEKMKTV